MNCVEARVGLVAGSLGLEAFDVEQLQGCIEWATEEVQHRDVELAELGDELADSELEAYEFIIQGLGVRRQDARKTTVVYNALSLRTRRAFRRVVLDHEAGSQLVGEGWHSLSEVRDDVLEALEVILGRGLETR